MMKTKNIVIVVLVLLAVSGLSYWRATQDMTKGTSMIVLSQFKQYSSEGEPPTTGAKFYHLKNNNKYSTARILNVEGGKITELATYPLEMDRSRDEYLTLSLFPERSGEDWCTWCSRSASGQDPFLQGPIEEGWRVANVSRSRLMRLESDEEMIDTIVYARKGQYIEMSDYNKIWNCESVEELESVTSKIKDCRVVVLQLTKH